jgi:hypothetical protein
MKEQNMYGKPSTFLYMDQDQIHCQNKIRVCIIIAIIKHSNRWTGQKSLWI